MNKLFNNIRCRMMAKSAAIMGLIASSLFSANADLGDNIANSTKSNETVIMQNMDNAQIKETYNTDSSKTKNISHKSFYDRLTNGVAQGDISSLEATAQEMINKYNIVLNLNAKTINKYTKYLKTITNNILDSVSNTRSILNNMLGAPADAKVKNEIKTILNNIFAVQNKAISHLFNNGIDLYALQDGETFLSKIIRSGINVEGLNINEAIKNTQKDPVVLKSITKALLDAKDRESNLEGLYRTQQDVKTNINALTERLNQADVKNSPDAQNFSNIRLIVNYATSADKLVDTFDKSIRQAAQTIVENQKVINAERQLRFQKDKKQIDYYKAIIQQGIHAVDTHELENFYQQHMSLLNEMSQLASSNDLNSDLALTLINKITHSRTSLNTALSNIIDMKSGLQETVNATIALNAKTLEENIIKAQDNVLANILNNSNVDIYKTNGDNPSILSTVITSNAKISGFNLVDAVKNCPNNLESLKSLVEGGYARTNIKTPIYDFESVNNPNESMDIVFALLEKIKQAGLEDGEQKDLQENLLLQNQILKEDRGYVKPSIFSVNNTYNNYDDDDDEYEYEYDDE